MISVLRDAGLSALIDPASDLERIADGFEFTEGPLWQPDGALLFQDIKAERTYRLDDHGRLGVLREHTRAANGQTFAPDGKIVFCEQNGRRVSRMDADGGRVETLVEAFEGKRLNSPNDIVCRGDGLIYFTDPAYGAPPDRPMDYQGVYVMDPDGANMRLLVADFEKPNGLAFSPDERTLHICDTGRYHVRSFAVLESGQIQRDSGRVFCTLDPGVPGGPDGMKVDRSGRLYIAVALGVWVFEPGGRLLGILSTPKRPSNLAWCGPDANVLAITMIDEVVRVRLKTRGVSPPFTPKSD